MSDYLIKNALVIDGTGIPWYKADVTIEGEKITTVSKTPYEGHSKHLIDAQGLALSPGFVDMHTHADISLFTNPYGNSLVRQGVTLVLTGNCGSSPAPLNEQTKQRWLQRLRDTPMELKWSTYDEYLNHIDAAKFSVNVATQIGHNTVRAHVMGNYAKQNPSKSELDIMISIIDDAMRAGAFGMSSGLMYNPGIWSKTEEIIELCKTVSEWGGIYSTHMRGEANEVLQSVLETIRIAEEAQVSTNISHHRAECRVNWGHIRHTLKMIQETNRKGNNVTCDFFPYLACGVGGGIPLPRWANPLYMPKEEALRIIKNPETRKEIKEQIRLGTALGPEARSYEPIDSTDDVVITIYPDHPELQGKTVTEIADIIKHEDPLEFFLDTVTSERPFGVVAFDIWEEDLKKLIMSPLAMIGTDSGFVDDVTQPNRHPRAYGSYPRILGRFVRDEGLITIEEAVMKLSTRPHAKLGIFDRGLIRAGFYADLVLFDPDTVIDKADYSGKAAYPEGIEHVFVNGELVVSKGEHTTARPGKLLRHSNG